MNSIQRHIPFCLLITTCAAFAGGPFMDLSFDEALKKAQKENKPVFVDFYATWCGPCKQMDQTVFKDKKVIQFLKEKTISIKIDVDKHEKLSEKYKVNNLPLLAILKPDGTLVDMYESAITDSDEFIEEISGMMSGVDASTRAYNKFKQFGGKDNPTAAWEYIRKLVQLEEYEEATRQLLWCFDNGIKQNDHYCELRMYIPILLAQISDAHPAAKDELKKRQEPAFKAMEEIEKQYASQPENTEQLRKQAEAVIPAYLGFCRINGEHDKAARLFDKYRTDENKELASIVLPFIFPHLLKQKEYSTIAEYSDIQKNVGDIFDSFDEYMKHVPAEKRKTVKKKVGIAIANEAANYYQVLLGLGKTKEASSLAARILMLSQDEQTYNLLSWNGYLSGRAVQENLAQAKKAYSLAGKKDAAILDTLVRVMDQLGKKEQACELLKKEFPKYKESQYDQLVLKKCESEIGCTEEKEADDKK